MWSDGSGGGWGSILLWIFPSPSPGAEMWRGQNLIINSLNCTSQTPSAQIVHPTIWYWGNMQIIKDLFNYIQLFLTFLRKTRVPNVSEQKWSRTEVGKNVNGSSSWCSGRGQKTASSDVGREGDKGRRTEARPGRASVHCVQHSQTTILDGKKVTNSPKKNILIRHFYAWLKQRNSKCHVVTKKIDTLDDN